MADGNELPAPGVDELAERICALPRVRQQIIENDDRFFFLGAEQRRPFATIVQSDVPGWDEESQLNRPGVFRLNMELGTAEFERLFGYPPSEADTRREPLGYARADVVQPHPSYGSYGWASIINPARGSMPEVDRLLAHAHARHNRGARAGKSGEDASG